MEEKQYDPARHNEESPAKGMAAVNTHNPNEKEYPKTGNQVSKETNVEAGTEERNLKDDRQ